MSTGKRTAGAIDELQIWGRRVSAKLSRHRKRLDIHSELERLDISLERDDPRVARILEELKLREARGYAYEGADASFELLARRLMGQVPQYFSVDSYHLTDKCHAVHGRPTIMWEASVCLLINGGSEHLWSVSEGMAPVNALDHALRKDLGPYQPHIENIELADYKVRVLMRGGEPVTRVLVECYDRSTGESWFTVGVSPNIVDASFEALVDSINYKLLKNNAEVAHALAS
jgi:2-isopropylmalate synthase